MNKTKKINKLGLVLTLVLVIALALVLSASATSVIYNTSDTTLTDIIEENIDPVNASLSTGSSVGSYINYGNVPNGNFTIAIIEVSNDLYTYTTQIYWVSDIEAFQTRYSGYTFYDFFTELESYEYYGLMSYFTPEAFSYLLNYQLPVSQEQFDRLAQEYSTLEQIYKQLVISNNTLQGEYNTLQDYNNTLESNYNTLLNDFNTLRVNYEALQGQYSYLQGEYNTLQGEYNTLQGEYNTLQGEYNTLENSIPNIKANAKQEGYNEGMTDADAVERGVMSIVGAPMYIITSVFDVEIFGISLLNLITTIMTVIIVAWVIKKLAN